MPTEAVELIELHVPEAGLTYHEFRVQHLGGGQYRICEIPVVSEDFEYQDVIETQERADGGRDFASVVVRAGWRRHELMVSRDLAESPKLQALLDRATAAGGTWSRFYGGCFAIALPPACEWNPERDLAMITGGTTRA